MATLSLQNLHKSYGKNDVIHGIDLDIEDGEFIVIVGPSGCGKSTLLRMVAGLETITDGELKIDGRRVNELEPRERDIAMVFQNYALYPHMSVFDNMAYGLKIANTPREEIRQRVDEAAQLLELTEFLDRKPKALSGGQRQRVAMGRAIVRKPAVFLFDEPLSNLDAKLRVQMRNEIKALQRKLGVTALYVTHDQVEAMTLADRMIVLNKGVAEQIGAPIDVYKRPQTTFVGGFIGSPPMNFLIGHCQNQELRIGDMVLQHPVSLADGQWRIGIRPEHCHLSKTSESMITLTVTVSHQEVLGAETLIHAKLADQPMTIRIEGEAPTNLDTEDLVLNVNLDDIRLYDAEDRYHPLA